MSDEYHPIDYAESFAEKEGFDFDRMDEDQIAMSIKRTWRTYSLTLAQSDNNSLLRMILSFEMQPPEEQYPALYEMLNLVNHLLWVGAFAFWEEQQLMVYRYGLLTGEDGISAAQVETIINTACDTSERYYPAFQLATWGNRSPEEALQAAFAEAYGRA